MGSLEVAASLITDEPANMVGAISFTSYLVNSDDIPKYMSYRANAYPKFFPNKLYPPHTLTIVTQLVQKPLLVEVTAMAALL